MLQNGLYHASFSAPARIGPALFALHNGQLIGVGHFGGDYQGTYREGGASNLTRLDFSMALPAGTPIVVPLTAEAAAATFHHVCEFEDGAAPMAVSLELSGTPVVMVLRFVDPLPKWPVAATCAAGDGPARHQDDELRDGFYRMIFSGAHDASAAILLIADHRFSGIGQLGARYAGQCPFNPQRSLHRIEGQALFPPAIALVTGATSGAQGVTLPFSTEMKVRAGKARFSLGLANRTVDVAMSYVRDLPVQEALAGH